MLRNRSTARRGFTLVELLVVVLIIGILMAVAIPFYLGYRNSSADRAAQSNLTTAMTAAQQIAVAKNSLTTATDTELVKVEPNIAFSTGAVTNAASNRVVSVAPADKLWYSAAVGRDGRCWYAAINLGTAVTNGPKAGTSYAGQDVASCTAATPPAVSTVVWQTSFDAVVIP